MRVGLLITITIVICSCRKTPPENVLPPITESGKHSLGFILNGEPWVPYDRGNHEKNELPLAQVSDHGLKITATRIDEENSCRNWFCIEVSNQQIEEGSFQLTNKACTSPYQSFYYGEKKHQIGEHYKMDDSALNELIIRKIDQEQRFISGTFSFRAISPQQDTIKVTNGRFDLRYEKVKEIASR